MDTTDVETVYPEVRKALRALRAPERWARQDAREMEKARALSLDALKRKSRTIASAAAQMHRKGDKRAPIWDRRAGVYARVEAEHEQAEQERIERDRHVSEQGSNI
jgi:hypothetical protein